MILDFINVRTSAYLDCGFSLVDVRDVVKGHILVAEHGERYILGNENVTLNELLRFLEKITGLEMPKMRVPYWLALITGDCQDSLQIS